MAGRKLLGRASACQPHEDAPGEQLGYTHGLMGSLSLSSRSSTLLVCCRMASSGLCSDLSSAGPPKGLGAAMP